MDHVVVFVTAKDEAEAEKISQLVLAERLVACVNVIKDVKSFYWWQGSVAQDDEVLLVMKTQQQLFEKIVSVVKSHHSYGVPEIIGMPIVVGHSDYLNWIDESVISSK